MRPRQSPRTIYPWAVERDSQESCFAVNRAVLCPLPPLRGSEKGRYATRTGPLRRSSSFLDRRGNWVVPLMILINCSYNGSGRPPTANPCRARATIFSFTPSCDDAACDRFDRRKFLANTFQNNPFESFIIINLVLIIIYHDPSGTQKREFNLYIIHLIK